MPRDLLRVEPSPRCARLGDDSLGPHDLDDACHDGVAESDGELVDHGRIERQLLGAGHIGTVKQGVWTSQPRL